MMTPFSLAQRLQALSPGRPPAQAMLFYHFTLFEVILSYQPCPDCLSHGKVLKAQAADLHQLYQPYRQQLLCFDRRALKMLMQDCIKRLDLTTLCQPCLAHFQQDWQRCLSEQARRGPLD